MCARGSCHATIYSFEHNVIYIDLQTFLIEFITVRILEPIFSLEMCVEYFKIKLIIKIV